MKKLIIILALAVLMPLFAAAQHGGTPVSLVAHLGGGLGAFPERNIGARTDHFIGALGADAKFGLSDKWSLLVGLEYQIRYSNISWVGHYGNYGVIHNNKILRGHYLRLPIRVEFDYKWFYASAGPYLEKGFGNMPAKNELGLAGADLELGGRIKLGRNDRLRIGWLTSYGCSFDNRKPLIDYKELDFLLRIGYEHLF